MHFPEVHLVYLVVRPYTGLTLTSTLTRTNLMHFPEVCTEHHYSYAYRASNTNVGTRGDQYTYRVTNAQVLVEASIPANVLTYRYSLRRVS